MVSVLSRENQHTSSDAVDELSPISADEFCEALEELFLPDTNTSQVVAADDCITESGRSDQIRWAYGEESAFNDITPPPKWYKKLGAYVIEALYGPSEDIEGDSVAFDPSNTEDRGTGWHVDPSDEWAPHPGLADYPGGTFEPPKTGLLVPYAPFEESGGIARSLRRNAASAADGISGLLGSSEAIEPLRATGKGWVTMLLQSLAATAVATTALVTAFPGQDTSESRPLTVPDIESAVQPSSVNLGANIARVVASAEEAYSFNTNVLLTRVKADDVEDLAILSGDSLWSTTDRHLTDGNDQATNEIVSYIHEQFFDNNAPHHDMVMDMVKSGQLRYNVDTGELNVILPNPEEARAQGSVAVSADLWNLLWEAHEALEQEEVEELGAVAP